MKIKLPNEFLDKVIEFAEAQKKCLDWDDHESVSQLRVRLNDSLGALNRFLSSLTKTPL